MSLIAKDVTFAYPGATRPTITDLSLDLTPGHVIALCGAARSGRSTALALLAGLLSPRQGSVSVDSVAVTAAQARGRVGLLLQNADEALFGLTVIDDVMFAPLQHDASQDDARQLAQQALRAVHLDPDRFGQRSPFALSGGQRRRAAIAGIMAMEPSYLLLDEPFVGLDPQGRAEIVDVIRSIATASFGEHTGILIALTDLDMATHLADTLVILAHGSPVWQGSVASFVAEAPDVTSWSLRQPDLVALAKALRDRGWRLPLDAASPDVLATAIAAQTREGRS